MEVANCPSSNPGRCRQVAKAADCKSATVGSTPTSASFFFRRSAVVAVLMLVAGASSAQAQIGIFPSFDAPVPGSAPTRIQEEELEIGPYARNGAGSNAAAAPGGEMTRQYTEDELNGHFDGRVADEFYEAPGCSGISERVCYGYFSLDALYWDRVHTNSATFGILSSTGAFAVGGSDFVWNDYEVLPRLTAGWVFDTGWSVEGNYIYKDDFDTNIMAVQTDNLSMSAFGATSAAFAPNFFQVDAIGASVSTAIQSGEVNMIQTNNYFNVIAGFRWMELQDRLWLTTYDDTLGSTRISTYNKLFGGQLGLRMSQTYAGIFSVQAQVKGGYYVNYSRGHTQIINAGAGLPDQTRNSRGNSDAVIAEGEIMATYNPRIWCQFRAGFQVFTVMNTALANDQIFNTDFTGFGNVTRGDLVYFGPFAGLEMMW